MPHFRTIANFRKTHLLALKGLFEQVLRLAREMGAPRVGRVALDGSKIKANASKHKAMSYGRMREKQRQLREEVNELLRSPPCGMTNGHHQEAAGQAQPRPFLAQHISQHRQNVMRSQRGPAASFPIPWHCRLCS